MEVRIIRGSRDKHQQNVKNTNGVSVACLCSKLCTELPIMQSKAIQVLCICYLLNAMSLEYLSIRIVLAAT